MARRSIDPLSARLGRVAFWVTAAVLANAAVWLAVLIVTVSPDGLRHVGRVWAEARLVIPMDPGRPERARRGGRCENGGYAPRDPPGPCPTGPPAAGGVRGPAAPASPASNARRGAVPRGWRRGG